MRVLLVEDQTELRQAVAKHLREKSFSVDEAGDLATARLLLPIHDFAVIIMDRMLPDGDGAHQVEHWRREGVSTPTILLTAKGKVEERVEGLQAGADDYLVKPFAMDELLARVSAVARRRGSGAPATVVVGNLEIDLARRQAKRNGMLLPLRPKEYAVLEYLATHLGQAISRRDLHNACWDTARESSSNVEEVVVAALRRKLGNPTVVHTVRGFGYVLEVGSDA
ncbi:MAG: response regulator transcription factor [Planctomycetota bacterium]